MQCYNLLATYEHEKAAKVFELTKNNELLSESDQKELKYLEDYFKELSG